MTTGRVSVYLSNYLSVRRSVNHFSVHVVASSLFVVASPFLSWSWSWSWSWFGLGLGLGLGLVLVFVFLFVLTRTRTPAPTPTPTLIVIFSFAVFTGRICVSIYLIVYLSVCQIVCTIFFFPSLCSHLLFFFVSHPNSPPPLPTLSHFLFHSISQLRFQSPKDPHFRMSSFYPFYCFKLFASKKALQIMLFSFHVCPLSLPSTSGIDRKKPLDESCITVLV